jgi:predicted nucleic acid-binding protein
MASTLDVADAIPVEPIRAFTDSSMLFTASISGSGPALSVFRVAQRGRLVLFASPYALGEAERSLYRKNPGGPRAFWELRDQLSLVDPSPELTDQVAREIEAKDAAIVAGAIVARASYLVTYDRRHLLSKAEQIRQWYGIETIMPMEAFHRMEDGQ